MFLGFLRLEAGTGNELWVTDCGLRIKVVSTNQRITCGEGGCFLVGGLATKIYVRRRFEMSTMTSKDTNKGTKTWVALAVVFVFALILGELGGHFLWPAPEATPVAPEVVETPVVYTTTQVAPEATPEAVTPTTTVTEELLIWGTPTPAPTAPVEPESLEDFGLEPIGNLVLCGEQPYGMCEIPGVAKAAPRKLVVLGWGPAHRLDVFVVLPGQEDGFPAQSWDAARYFWAPVGLDVGAPANFWLRVLEENYPGEDWTLEVHE